MSAAAIEIPWSPRAAAVLEKMQAMPNLVRRSVEAGMNHAAPFVISKIQRERLLGQGPFPVDEHRLGQVTSDLSRKTYATAAETTGNVTALSIGTPTPYAKVHEFGFNGQVYVQSFTRKNPKREVVEERTSKKTGKKYKARVKVSSGVTTVKGHTRWMHMPARAPFGFGLADSGPIFVREIEKELVAAWEGGAR